MGVTSGRRGLAVPVLAAVLAAVCGVLAGCTASVSGRGAVGPPPGTTARAATYLALTDLAAASAVRYQGTFANGGDTVTLDATVTSAGEATGTLTDGGNRIGLLVLQGVTYLRAPEAFWTVGGQRSGITHRYGSHWVRVPAGLFGLDVGTVLAPGALARAQHPGVRDVPDGPLSGLTPGVVDGVRSVAVQAQGTQYDLTAAQPYRLLRLRTPAVPRLRAGAPARWRGALPGGALPGGALPGGAFLAVPPKPGTPLPPAPDATDLDLRLSDASAELGRVYGELAARAGQLAGAIDGQGRITLGRQDFVGCGPAGCTIQVAFTNQDGAATRAGLHADWDGGDQPLGGCDGTTGPVAAHTAATVTCTIAGAGWREFYQRAVTSSGGLSYGARYSVLPLAAPPDAGRLAADAATVRCASGGTRPAGCPGAGAAEERDAAVRAGYQALGGRFRAAALYGAVRGPRPAGAAVSRVHPADGYPDLVVFDGDRVFVYQVAAAAAAERARRQVADHVAALRTGVVSRAVRAQAGPPIGTVAVRDPRLGRTVTLTSRAADPGVIFYSVG